jgi:hypothetical protein
VAELEATTARKGNRRMSLTVSGQVTRSILYWHTDAVGLNGNGSGTYAGLDNHNQSSRFVFSGAAKISPNLQAGFEFMTEITTARTSTVDQNTPDAVATSAAIANGVDGVLAVRTANWWLEDKNLGRLTVGRINVGGPVGTIDLGGISTVAHFSPSLVGGGFQVAGTPAEITAGGGTRLGSVIGPTYGGDRIEGIRWDSPTIGGFVAQATWGEDDIWSASLRYAGEFGGIRVAAGIGYQVQNPSDTQTIQLDTGARFLDNEWAASLAAMHVPSGLFAQGHYARSEFLNGADAKFWMVQAGITKNWWGLGNTSFYGEYGRADDFIKSGIVFGTGVQNAQAGIQNASSEVKFFGLGVVQQIDAAAMEVYLGWRRFETDISGITAPNVGQRNGSSDLDLVHGGARIRF